MPELNLKEDGEGERGPLELAVSMSPKGPAESPGWLSSRFPKKKDADRMGEAKKLPRARVASAPSCSTLSR